MAAQTVRVTALRSIWDEIFTWRDKFIRSLVRLFAQMDANARKTDISYTSLETATELAGKLLDVHGDTILRVAYSYLHNMSDAEDILQETLIKVIKNKPVFESSAHEKAWLITVASNLSKNKIKYNKLRDTDELNEELVANDREDLSFIWEAVKQLPDNFREVIHLFYQEGYSTKDIAQILGRNESTVRSDLKRGRDRLKVVLKEAYDFE